MLCFAMILLLLVLKMWFLTFLSIFGQLCSF